MSLKRSWRPVEVKELRKPMGNSLMMYDNEKWDYEGGECTEHENVHTVSHYSIPC